MRCPHCRKDKKSTNAAKYGQWMDRKKISTYATDELTLRLVRQPSITVACLICNRHGAFDRQALIRRHGAGLTFHALRRRVAMGCAKMHEPDGVDRCGTHFPGFTSAGSDRKS
jgi:hypothetical protein